VVTKNKQMNIDRHNYEEYFILYMDNELSADGRRKVEEFAERNPDLKDELDTLMHFKLVPDTSVVFEDKSQLIKQDVDSPVNLANYEEWLVMYVDDELNLEEKAGVEYFISTHPEVQRELAALTQTKLQPELVLFPDKKVLYRTEERVRKMPVRWWRIAAAVVLFIVAGAITVVSINNKRNGDGAKELAKTPVNVEKINTETPVTNQAKENNEVTDATAKNNESIVLPVSNKAVSPDKTIKASKEGIVKSKPVEKKKSVVVDEMIKTQQQVIAGNNNKLNGSNNLPKPLNNPNIEKLSTDIASNIASNKLQQDVKDNNIVTTNPTETSDIKYASNAELDQPGGKKGKLRGLLRKVTRTFEKTTNIDATDDQDRVLIGGLALKLK
jgi:hypothetical protein